MASAMPAWLYELKARLEQECGFTVTTLERNRLRVEWSGDPDDYKQVARIVDDYMAEVLLGHEDWLEIRPVP